MPNKCLELTIFSGQRQSDSSIGQARYRIDNGPIFAGKLAVKSCTLYNTLPNVNVNRATMTFLQYGGPGDSLGLVQAAITPGAYSGSDLALALQTSMNTALAPTAGASVTVVYNALTRKLEFTFDNTYSYYYAPTYQQYYINSPGFTVAWAYYPSTGGAGVLQSNFVSGTYRVDEWLEYCSQVLTASAQAEEATAVMRLTNNYYLGNLNVTFESLVPGSEFLIGSSANFPAIYIGMDDPGMQVRASSYVSPVPFPYTNVGQTTNAIEPVLNFAVDGVVNTNAWQSGPVNLSGDLYLHFRSRILANRGHRSVENSRDTTFFSMPITSSYTQLQYYEPNERVWIDFRGGLEITDFEIDLFNEFDEPVELSQNYVLELLIQQTEVF